MSDTRWHCRVQSMPNQEVNSLYCIQYLWKVLVYTRYFTYLHFLQGLHVDAAALAVVHERQVKGVHQDDPSQARGVSALHIVQQHLSFVCLVADDGGDVG